METTDVSGAAAASIGMVGLIINLVIILFFIIVMWKIFTKAGQPGWASIIPIYNTYIILKIAGKPGWWLLLMFIPIVNFVVVILAIVALSENFGKGAGFAIGLILLSPIFYPILAFGSAEYSPLKAA
jgi:hypothetical protein